MVSGAPIGNGERSAPIGRRNRLPHQGRLAIGLAGCQPVLMALRATKNDENARQLVS
jgi:hypothetical protein